MKANSGTFDFGGFLSDAVNYVMPTLRLKKIKENKKKLNQQKSITFNIKFTKQLSHNGTKPLI